MSTANGENHHAELLADFDTDGDRQTHVLVRALFVGSVDHQDRLSLQAVTRRQLVHIVGTVCRKDGSDLVQRHPHSSEGDDGRPGSDLIRLVVAVASRFPDGRVNCLSAPRGPTNCSVDEPSQKVVAAPLANLIDQPTTVVGYEQAEQFDPPY